MKRLQNLIIIVLILSVSTLFAQSPEGFNYQGVIRDNGTVLASTPITVKINLRSSSPTGTIEYSETHTANTNDYGVFSLMVGQGNTLSGTFSSLNWGNSNFFVETEVDFGSGYQNLGTTQLMSVPYALHAKNGSMWEDNSNELYYTTDNVGIGTNNPDAQLHVDSTIAITSGGEYYSMEVGADGNLAFYPDYANPTSFSDPVMTLGNGTFHNVGIGTDDPQEKLHIANGGVKVEETTTSPEKNTMYGNALPLAYGYISTVGSISQGYGIASVNSPSTGVYDITLDNSFTGYPVVMITAFNNSATNDEIATYSSSPTDNEITIRISDETGSAQSSAFSVVVFGTAQ